METVLRLLRDTTQHSNGNKNEDEIPQCGSERTITSRVKCHHAGAGHMIVARQKEMGGTKECAHTRSVCVCLSSSVFYMQ